MNSKAPLTVALIAAPACLMLAIASMPPVTADTNPGPAVVDKKALFSERCSACHDLPDPTQLSYTRAEWRRTVDTMLNKYKASDEISPTEADEIVDYLATFAPRDTGARGGGVDRQWAAEEDDVWFSDPTRSIMTNFEAPGELPSMTRAVGGENGHPVWKLTTDSDAPDGTVVDVTSKQADAGSFALLIDPRSKASDVDVKVRFKIVSGDDSPAVGIVVGLQDQGHYDVVKYNRKTNDLTLLQIAEPVHTTLQQTPVELPGAAGLAQTVSLNSSPGQWHTLRVQVRDGHLRGWVDSYKRINIGLTDYNGGEVALWSQGDTEANFDDWSTDIYDPVPGSQPSGAGV